MGDGWMIMMNEWVLEKNGMENRLVNHGSSDKIGNRCSH